MEEHSDSEESYDGPTGLRTTIVTQNMCEAVEIWLTTFELDQYMEFFNHLSYNEIECLDEETLRVHLKLTRYHMGRKDREEICEMASMLRSRPLHIRILIKSLIKKPNYDILVKTSLSYLNVVLYYPIPNAYCVDGTQLQEDIIHLMELCAKNVDAQLDRNPYYVSNSIVGKSATNYLACATLIIENNAFNKSQISLIQKRRQFIYDKVRRMEESNRV